MDDTAVSRVPAEVWLAIFELLVHKYCERHIFDQLYRYRIAAVHELQGLQLVCRLWADLVRSLTYRHAAFTNFTRDEKMLGGLVDVDKPGSGSVVRVPQFLGHTILEHAPRSRGIHTLSLHPHSGATSPTLDSILPIQDLFPHLTHLTTFVCHTVLSPSDFDTLTSTLHSSLTTLLVTFDARIPSALLYFNRLTNLADLSLVVSRHNDPLQVPYEGPACMLPRLTRVDVTETNNGIFYVLSWLRSIEESTIEVVNVRTPTCLICVLLMIYLKKHAGSLKTLGLSGPLFRDLRFLFRRMPGLERVEVRAPSNCLDEVIAQMLQAPRRVESVTKGGWDGETAVVNILPGLKGMEAFGASRCVHGMMRFNTGFGCCS
ncbi:hypothetical protein CC86DRAFT_455062 [Ophiobolus disseminans]|uniref:F-box domain-containing protein n=1 Tax=Ophiobolus disseminans TaxID=1469910 RepID=A0A6A7A249_9PLEO|nr:hypothetical protein CC86DRAFT_455062 [Ophiobolus disseminans]